METVQVNKEFYTHINEEDKKILLRLIDTLGPLITLQTVGFYSSMNSDDLWMTLVGQICVMGSALLMDRLVENEEEYAEFETAISLSVLKSHQDLDIYLAEVLRQYSATRFHRKAAERLVRILNSPQCFQDGNLLLLNGLSHQADLDQTREELIRRCPVFGLKSASDFMISVGLSHDIIALDTRIVGFFERYLDYNLGANRVQSNRKIYFSIEQSLRNVCRQKKVSWPYLTGYYSK